MNGNHNHNAGSSASQKERILSYLLAGHGITPLAALRMFGTLRLGARIADLREEGYDIRTEMVEDEVTGKRYAMYSLVNDPVQLKLF